MNIQKIQFARAIWVEQASLIYIGLDPWRHLIHQKSMEKGEKGASLTLLSNSAWNSAYPPLLHLPVHFIYLASDWSMYLTFNLLSSGPV